MAISAKPHAGAGAEVSGVDLANLTGPELEQVKALYAEYGLLFFRDQSLDEKAHIALAEQFGDINVNRFFAAHPDYPQIATVIKEADQELNIGGGWHTDHSYDVEPAMGSILVAKELPASGGDTWFLSMQTAFEGLSEGLKDTLRGLRAVHSAKHIFGAGNGYSEEEGNQGRIGNTDAAAQLSDPIHPVVIKHPLSGKEVLYVNPTFTLHFEGWTGEESMPLLNYLYEQAAKPENVCKFEWKPGSVAFWDNRSTWHFAQNDYHGSRREMHRITIEGCGLEPSKAA